MTATTGTTPRKILPFIRLITSALTSASQTHERGASMAIEALAT
jgi:hypothetical protein